MQYSTDMENPEFVDDVLAAKQRISKAMLAYGRVSFLLASVAKVAPWSGLALHPYCQLNTQYREVKFNPLDCKPLFLFLGMRVSPRPLKIQGTCGMNHYNACRLG